MRNLRIDKASKLMIGTRRPNILIPIMYGSIARVLAQNIKGDLDEAIRKAIKGNNIPEKELREVVSKYETLSHQVKRRWSGEDYPKLMQIATFAEAAKRFLQLEHEVNAARKYLRHGFNFALGPVYPSSYPGLQDPCIPDPDMPHPCPPTPPGGCTCPPEPGGSPGPTAPPNRYIWEFGPSLHCYDPYEDFLGDDLYAVRRGSALSIQLYDS